MSDLAVQGDGAAQTAAPTKQDYGTGINIVVKHAEFDGVIDMSKLSWRDSKELRKKRKALQDGEINEDDLVGVLDELVRKLTGREPDELPAEVVDKIAEILFVGDAKQKEAEKN